MPVAKYNALLDNIDMLTHKKTCTTFVSSPKNLSEVLFVRECFLLHGEMLLI